MKNDLKNLRLSNQLTQSQMAIQLGISKSYYSKLEQGVKRPSRGFMERIKLQYPDVSLEIFF